MGLDTVELVLEIEDAFSIKIPDDVANGMITVGDVFDYIVAKTSVPTNSSVCLSAAAFYSLRRAATALGATNRLRPSDSILTILPDLHRREYWAQLQDRSKLKLSALRRADWLVTLCTLVVITFSALLGVFTYQSTNSQLVGFVCAVATGVSVGFIAGWMTRPLAIYPASNCTTLRGLAESALGLNFKALSDRYGGASTNDLWLTLRAIIVEQLGVSPEEVRPTASFVKDLGCD